MGTVVTEELADKDYSSRNFETDLALIPAADERSAKRPAPCGANNLAWQ
jgi:hypothetical protein